ncbi:phosphoribosylamine--glycine ligase [Periweissella cryptocerci]|uniref:Phosphoribosylamine--glycine ligase n=1 Tax=Periweissella cryptocerci TaxID=2506420 RepID=A0A4P6YS37_9LACO|nr:phosphoribosylamine--glycine ligase [Periweissella cryptocerci]QBO35487.1 phosphoribosylamine--glycine ligase [Periweissella cryptocerci]
MAQVLVIGTGAREHAFAQKLIASPQVDKVFVAPGNPGITGEGIETVAIAVDDLAGLVTFAQQQAFELTVVGMENPLIDGIVDEFRQVGLPIFGPSGAAAVLEGSKSFTKDLLQKYAIPTAKYQVVNDFVSAQTYIATQTYPLVFKADGLALGKGVTIIESAGAAQQYLTQVYAQAPDTKLVIEEYLVGQEFSLFSLVGENQVIHTPIAQDHKRLLNGDLGPNTGGMGAYSPVPQFSQAMVDAAIQTIVEPTLAAMKAEGRPFTGILYTGIMQTVTGPKTIEFNVRFGDPEAQVVLPQLESDLYEVLLGLVTGKPVSAKWQTAQTYLGVVLASSNYPVSATKGQIVPTNVPKPLEINYASVAQSTNGLVTAGGRVATVIAHASDIEEAQHLVYDYLEQLDTPLQYRRDIGAKALVN